ncbi:MAG: GNAT family N-acetyltransferase [Muribaculaceae bacterium]|nr:GNAT family N-acetyltransferase [Muribaculaceae bacterium]
MPATDLETQSVRIRLRALEPLDVDTLYEWENDRSLWEAGSTIAPFSRKQLWDYINNYDGDIYSARQLRLMIYVKETRQTIGTLDLFDFDPANSRCGVGIFVVPSMRLEGYASEALALVCRRAEEVLSLHQLTAVVEASNQASRGLFEGCGFKALATLPDWLRRSGGYADAILYSRIL